MFFICAITPNISWSHFFGSFSNSYALSSPKAQAVAQETLAVWCSLASKLGAWALKSELEDLCFAVLQVSTDFTS